MSSCALLQPALESIAPAAEVPITLGSSKTAKNQIVVAVLVLLALLVGFWPLFEQPALPMDEGSLLVYPELISRGQLPYRDFETFYGPANLWILATAYSAFGTNIFVERTVGLVYRLVILIAIFGIARRWGVVLGGGTMLIAGMLLIPLQLAAYAWLGALACGLIALWLSSLSERKWRCFLAGVFAGLALLFRPDVGPAVILAALPLLYGISWRRRFGYLGGIAVGLLPLALLTAAVGPTQVFNNLFLFPVVHCNPGRRLPLSAAAPSLLGLLFFHFLACAVNLGAGFVVFWRERDKQGARLLLATALFSVGLTFQATQRLDIVHFLFPGFLSISLLPISLVVLAQARRACHSLSAVRLLALVSVIATVQTIAPETTLVIRNAFAAAFNTSRSTAIFVAWNNRPFPFRSAQAARAAAEMFHDLETSSKAGERLFVGPADLSRTNYSDTFIYHLFPQLIPATYFLEMNPFSANRPASRLAADVRTADWLILDRSWDHWDEPNHSIEHASEAPNEVVRDEFEVRGEYGHFILLRRKS